MLNAYGQEWRFAALCGTKGALGCHSEWISSRCRTSGPWSYLVLIAGALLVVRDDQPNMAVHQVLHMLFTAWQQLAQGPFTPQFLYQGYISIFGAPARHLSDRGANFMSSVIDEMCKILGMKKLWTMPYDTQTNGLVERLHQMLMHMIGKLGEDKRASWPSPLAEIMQACNATHSAVTGYSLHYLMFRQRPRLPADFYFPTEAPMREASIKCVDEYLASVWDRLRTAFWEVQTQSMAEACQQNSTVTER